MNISEIRESIVAALAVEGIVPSRSQYDDTSCLVSVYPDSRWPGATEYAECLICIFADRVQKFERAVPFNYTTGRLIGSPVFYTTILGMVSEVSKLKETKVAPCWS